MAEASDKIQMRRAEQRGQLIACAERVIATEGLGALRARDLARDMGCAVGGLYNLVADLDELTLLVARRTQAKLIVALDAASAGEDSETVLVAWAQAYFRFACENQLRWRALFDFRLPPQAMLPSWFVEEQERVFLRLEDRLASLAPTLDAAGRKLKARVLFAAVHGIVALSLEEKVTAMPIESLDVELNDFVRSYLRGLRRPAPSDEVSASPAP